MEKSHNRIGLIPCGWRFLHPRRNQSFILEQTFENKIKKLASQFTEAVRFINAHASVFLRDEVSINGLTVIEVFFALHGSVKAGMAVHCDHICVGDTPTDESFIIIFAK